MSSCSSTVFGTLPDGSDVTSWTLRNGNGMEVEILNFGAIIRRISYPIPTGEPLDVVLGYKDIGGYVQDRAWIGAIAGRVAGRIPGGRLAINGICHQLPINQPPNHLHGGPDSLNRKVWRGEVTDGGPSIRLIHSSPHGDQGYPGEVIMAVTYLLTDMDELIFTTEAFSLDQTPISITQHSYFNLAGEGHGDIRDHLLSIDSDTIVPVNQDGALSDCKTPVEGTASDLRNPMRIGDMVSGVANQHLDFYWFGDAGNAKHMARLFSLESGLQMDVFSTHDCLQAYSAMDMNGTYSGKSGHAYKGFAGVCLEAEGYPNACSADGFGNILTTPRRLQKHVTTYAFRHCHKNQDVAALARE